MNKKERIQKKNEELFAKADAIKTAKAEAEKVKTEVAEVEAETEKKQSPVSSHVVWYKTLFLIFGVVCFIAAIGMGYFYYTSMNAIFAVGFIAFAGGGVFLVYTYRNKGGGDVTQYVGKPKTEQVNSLCLYPDEVTFEEIYEPKGHPWKCRNDGKYYYVNIWKDDVGKNGGLVPFILPDQQYYDPNLFAERVLELPAHRRIFRRKNNLMNAIKIGALLLGMIIVWILIITTTGDKGEPSAWLPTLNII